MRSESPAQTMHHLEHLTDSAELRRCVGDPAQFVRQHWQRTPLLRVGADRQGFVDLLSVADIDHMISSPLIPPSAFRMAKSGEILDPARHTTTSGGYDRPVKQLDSRAVYARFDEGATFILEGLQLYWAPVTRFCRALELALTHPVNANAYITPRGTQGLPLHSDDHDVFVLQLSGRKRWQVYPLDDVSGSAGPGDPAPDSPLEVELTAGDLLYVPQDCRHRAHTTDTFSAHLTIGVVTHRWGAVFDAALKDMTVAFDQSLPLGFAESPSALTACAAEYVRHLRDLVGGLDPAALAAMAARRFWANRPPLLPGQLTNLINVDGVHDATLLRRRPDAVGRLSVEPGRVQLLLGDQELDLPAHVEPVLAHILTGVPFMPAELGEHLDQAGRLTLVRRLVREGLLELVGDDRHSGQAPKDVESGTS